MTKIKKATRWIHGTWDSIGVHQAPTGYVVQFNSQISGAADLKILVPFQLGLSAGLPLTRGNIDCISQAENYRILKRGHRSSANPEAGRSQESGTPIRREDGVRKKEGTDGI